MPRPLTTTAALLLFACTASAQAPQRPNLLLVTIDTLRADRVGAYGHAGAATPALDRLAREGVRVEEAIVAAPMTRPSHATLFTGRHPYEHGLRDNGHGPLAPRWPTLATQLRTAGYDTAGFVGAYPVSRASGLDRGFHVYDDPFSALPTRGEPRSERRGAEVVDAALRWLSQPRQAPFFAWVHLFDPHAPYEAPEPFGSRFAGAPYDGEVAYADAQVGRLLSALDRAGVASGTLVVVTSDHGEGLGEHDEAEHMLLVYDTTLKVPLLLRWPGSLPAGAQLGGQFRAVDLLPTLLELLGRPAVATSGASRAGELKTGRALPDAAAYAESLYGQIHFGWAPLRALRGEGYKYVSSPRPELYDLRADPGETRNLAEARPQLATGMAAALARHREDGGPALAPAAADPQAAERLAALGYVGGSGYSGTPSGADPKDEARAFSAWQVDSREAVRLYAAGELTRALALLQRLARSPIPAFNVSYYLGRTLVDLRRFAEAVAPLEQAVRMAPGVGPAWAYLAEANRAAGRPAEALEAIRRGLAAVPGHAGLRLARGRLALEAGDLARAATDLEAARETSPDDPDVRTALSDLYRARGDAARALAEADAAVRLEPTAAGRHVLRGLALGAAGREAEAGEAFAEALRRDPRHPDALFFRAAILRRAGHDADAVPLLERLVDTAPDYPGAAAALAAARSRTVSASEPGRVRMRLIRVANLATAEQVRQRLAAGEDFARLAIALSHDPSAATGGDLGAVQVADLAEPLRSAAAGLEPGAVSAPVDTGRGWVVLKRER